MGCQRFTPTRVGKPARGRRYRRVLPVHPHPRGEAATGFRYGWALNGSPPPAWGSRLGIGALPVDDRFTPTRLGKPPRWCALTGRRSVHPHPRGEALALRVRVHGAIGSPPPAWGSRAEDETLGATFRFTPTRVGKPSPPLVAHSGGSVHPHPRGEAPGSCATLTSAFGSPPPAWGSPVTPCDALRDALGSPPPAWGSLAGVTFHAYRQRFTPTRVGKPPVARVRSRASPVHPHPRGEAHFRSCPVASCIGSPPPAWGSLRVASR
mgnify:CR=1 FL=1